MQQESERGSKTHIWAEHGEFTVLIYFHILIGILCCSCVQSWVSYLPGYATDTVILNYFSGGKETFGGFRTST